MNPLRSYFQDFIGLFFPELCAACGRNLFKNEEVVCTNCVYHLPVTNHHEDPDNQVAQQLWGRFPFEQAGAFIYFRKGNNVQKLIYQLKYNNRPEVGIRMGRLYGAVLKRTGLWSLPDYILPVPLHPSRKKRRGYNQSECIAKGLAEIMGIPVISDKLCRTENTGTQTRKARYDRYENLKEAFVVKDSASLENKHLLLVDDVITTGSTIEACSLELLKLKNVRVSIAALAFTG
ncbi:ComF family protein [Flavihumibacter sp. R14]|nr:ComF family protein [Flavihumibacter soli]